MKAKSTRISVSLNENDPRHVEIMMWLSSFDREGDTYRNRSASIQIVAVLHDYLTKNRRLIKKQSSIATSKKNQEIKNTEQQIVSIKKEKKAQPVAAEHIENPTAPIDISYQQAAPEPRRKASTGLFAVINKSNFDE